MQHFSHLPLLASRAYRCQCGNPVFFRNSKCLACGTPLGYDTALAELLPLMPGLISKTWVAWQPEPLHEAQDSLRAYTRCANLTTPAACNWLIPVEAVKGPQTLCQACRLNRTIPDLSDPEHPDNSVLWGRIELAKRRHRVQGIDKTQAY
ncbi:MAG: zinc-ribbon domain-containing protein, partial [Polaromonas sp.]|nr:zinc-ribbon domain-containing protein [Polaromonas sp.]